MTTLNNLAPAASFICRAFSLLWLVSPDPLVATTARRRFIRSAAIGAVGAIITLLGAGVGFLLWPSRSRAQSSAFLVGANEVPAVNGLPYLNAEGRFYLVHNEDGLLALSWRCTHLGCRALWQGPVDSPKAFECPCHASTFDYSGVRTGGPARRPFDLMKLTVNGDGSVTVNPRSLSSRLHYSPDQAVHYSVRAGSPDDDARSVANAQRTGHVFSRR